MTAFISDALKASGIFQSDGRAVLLAADHPYFGVVSGIEDSEAVLLPLFGYADALMVAPGTFTKYPKLRAAVLAKGTPVILRASGCVSTLSTEEDAMAKERLILTAERAKRLGASAVAVSVYVGTKYEDQTLHNLVTMAEQAEKAGIAVLGVVAVGKRLEGVEHNPEANADFLIRASRIAVEHGADFVKTYYCGSAFPGLVKACPVPVVVAGGKAPKENPTRSTLELAGNALAAGGSGIDFGRRVWRHQQPVAIAQALRAVVHERAEPAAALAKFGLTDQPGRLDSAKQAAKG